LWLHSLKVAQLLRSAACLHTNQSRSYLNHLVPLFEELFSSVGASSVVCHNVSSGAHDMYLRHGIEMLKECSALCA